MYVYSALVGTLNSVSQNARCNSENFSTNLSSTPKIRDLNLGHKIISGAWGGGILITKPKQYTDDPVS